MRSNRLIGLRASAACFVILALFCSGAAAASPSETESVVSIPIAAVPASVTAVASCDNAGLEFAWRQAFDARFLFGIKCPSNNQNSIVSLVVTDDVDGHGAAPIAFPATPYSQGELVSILSNIRVFADTRTIGEIFVDTEHPPGKPCRFESLFRFENHTPRLVFHRSSKHCDQAKSMHWRTLLDKRTVAEKKNDWN